MSGSSRVRSSPIRSNEAIHEEYSRVGLALSIFAALFFFLALWLLNGYFTSRTVRSLGVLFHAPLLSWEIGWLVHLIISLIEHHLWKLKDALGNAPRLLIVGVYGLIVAVGVVDVLTSAIAFLMLFSSFGMNVTDPPVRNLAVVLAEIIAIVPEPLIVWLSIALYRVMGGDRHA